MNSITRKLVGSALLAGLVASPALATPVAPRFFSVQERVNSDAAAIAEFQKRVKDYADLRDKVKGVQPAPKPTENPNALVARQERLARAIAAERQTAKAGDVFGATTLPRILRRTIADDLRRRTRAERAAVFQEVPKNLHLGVNETYPKSIPLATVPPRLLAALPPLPEGLEYRFVGRRLVLLDTVANMVVDILPEAVPAR